MSIHPALTLANKLREALDRWPEEWNEADADRIARLIYVLDDIADRRVKGERVRPW